MTYNYNDQYVTGHSTVLVGHHFLIIMNLTATESNVSIPGSNYLKIIYYYIDWRYTEGRYLVGT